MVFALSSACINLAHAEKPPELDFIGGYFDDGKYKCFQEPCFSIHENTPQGSSSTRFSPKRWPHWLDVDKSCQKEDQQLLAETSLIPVAYENDDRCKKVIAGKWKDSYTGEIIESVDQVAVDHRVSLKEAHSLRGVSWLIKKRALFANTPDNLIVVSKTSQQERDGKPANLWMPANERIWCDYVVHREKIARLFGLGFKDRVVNFHREIKRSHCKY